MKGREFMKIGKIVIVLLVPLFIFCGCLGKEIPLAELPYLTPSTKIIENGLGSSVHFKDYHNGDFLLSRFSMPTGTDDELPENASFLFSKETGEATELPVFKSDMCFDGKYFYCIGRDSEGNANLLAGSADFEYSEIVATLKNKDACISGIYHSGDYIIVPYSSEDAFYAAFYNTETGESFTTERLCKTQQLYDSIPCGGYLTYVEQKDGQYYLMGIDPNSPNKVICANSNPTDKILSCAFDGRTFVWETENGIYYCEKQSSKPPVFIGGKSEGFAFLGGRYIIFGDSGRKLMFIYDIAASGSSYRHILDFYDLKFFDYDECIAVYEPMENISDPEKAGSEYIVLELLNIDYGEEERWSVPYSLMIEDKTYYCFFEEAEIEISESDISGYLKSAIYDAASMPSENGQSNFAPVGSPYAFIDGNLYIYAPQGGINSIDPYQYEPGWFICEPS